jgi:hypothetical protein
LEVFIQNRLGASTRNDKDVVVVEIFESVVEVKVRFDGNALIRLDTLGGSCDRGLEGSLAFD